MTQEASPSISTLNAFEKHSHLFPASDDAPWANWLRCHRPNWRALMTGLKTGGYRLTIQARLLSLLFAPHFDVVPSRILVDPALHRDITDKNYVHMGHDDCLKGLDPELLPFLADLLCDGYDYRATSMKNSLLIDFLGVLPEELGEGVFTRCQWLSPFPYENGEEASGYHGYGRLMRNRDIPLSFKQRATAMMRDIVKNEVSGHTKPRVTWEAAVPCFIDELLLGLYDRLQLPFPRALLRGELEFLFTLPLAANVRIPTIYWDKLMQVFSRDTLEERAFRIALARNFFLNPPEYRDKHQFTTETEVILAERALGDLGDEEPAISKVIRDTIARSRQNVGRLTDDAKRRQRTEEALR